WIAPSPNLPTPKSAEWYPVLCWYEGTQVSVGRGTDAPFEQLGFPMHRGVYAKHLMNQIRGDTLAAKIGDFTVKLTAFKPISIPQKATNPIYENDSCYGYRLPDIPSQPKQLWIVGLELLRNFHHEYHEFYKVNGQPRTTPKPFFTPVFKKLAGNSELEIQIATDIPVEEIYQSWQPMIEMFRKKRASYLLYPN
ncbi:MAG: DUF1343 domain-containing protein, partial [Bacteroidia bacterium]|nr:DUF1343 domain-containing protein [Bacteroidia bacterium]